MQTRKNPARTAAARYQADLWDLQREIVKAIAFNLRVTIKSCHASGKTFVAARAVLNHLNAWWPGKVITTAPTGLQVEKLLWKEIKSAFDSAEPPVYGRCLNRELNMSMIDRDGQEADNPDHFAIGFSTEDSKTVRMQGWHSPNILIVVDEAAGVSQAIFDGIEALLTTGNAKLLLLGNPDEVSGAFYQSHKDSDFVKFTISAFDTPNFTTFGLNQEDFLTDAWRGKITGELPAPWLITPDWVATRAKKWGVESPLYVAKVLGRFPESSVDTLVGMADVEAAQERELIATGDGQWGLDVARFGSDNSELYYRRGDVVMFNWTFRHLDAIELSDWCEGIIKQIDPGATVVVDSVGVGAGVADILRDRNFNVWDYTGSGKASDPEFLNERAEFYWTLRQRFADGRIAGQIDEELKEELIAIKYKFSKAKVQIEEKDMIKKRLGRSPDKADGLMLAFAPVAVASDIGDWNDDAADIGDDDDDDDDRIVSSGFKKGRLWGGLGIQ